MLRNSHDASKSIRLQQPSSGKCDGMRGGSLDARGLALASGRRNPQTLRERGWNSRGR
jgi:hypothetical protein